MVLEDTFLAGRLCNLPQVATCRRLCNLPINEWIYLFSFLDKSRNEMNSVVRSTNSRMGW